MNGTELKFRMKECGLTMRRIAEELGYSYSTINSIMNNFNGVSQHKVNAVDKFITQCEQLIRDADKLETWKEKIIRLCNNQKLVLDEIIRQVQSVNDSEVGFKFSPEDEKILDEAEKEFKIGEEDEELGVF